MKLYEATAQLEVVNGWIEEHADEIFANGGELTPELSALLDEAEGTLAEKAERVALKVRELQAEAEVIKAEAVRLTQRAKTASNAADSLKSYLRHALDAAGIPVIKGTLVTVALQKNPPSVQGELSPEAIHDLYEDGAKFASMIPAQFVLDKKAVIAAHGLGAPIPAGLQVTQGTSLRIR